MSDTVTISRDEYYNLLEYKRAVESDSAYVLERRGPVKDGESKEILLVYTQEEYKEKVEELCETLYGAGKFEEGSKQELFALRSKVRRLENALKMRDGGVAYLWEQYEEQQEINIELKMKVDNSVHRYWRAAAIILGSAFITRIILDLVV